MNRLPFTAIRPGVMLLALAAGLAAAGSLVQRAVPPFSSLATAAMVAKAIGVFLVLPGTIKLAFAYWRARDAERTEAPPVPAGAVALVCPGCRRTTYHLKQVLLPDLTFMVIAWRMSSVRYTGCPACTRAIVEEYLLRNLLSAHVLWIAPAIRGAAALAESFAPGHSRDIARDLQAMARAQGA
jgi:hypothetical protein